MSYFYDIYMSISLRGGGGVKRSVFVVVDSFYRFREKIVIYQEVWLIRPCPASERQGRIGAVDFPTSLWTVL